MPIVGGAIISDLDVAVVSARMAVRARRGFLRGPTAARLYECHVTDVAGIVPRVVMHLRVTAIGPASDGKDVVLDHASRTDMKRRVREALPLARLLQIPAVVVIG